MDGLIKRQAVLPANADLQGYMDSQRKYRRDLVEKWMPLLEENKKYGTKALPEHLWEPMAMLFENQQFSSLPGLMEQTMTTDVVLPQKFALPLIRKIYPNTIASKIASIQPMPAESGGTSKIFYQDFETEDADSNHSLTVADSDYALGSEGGVPKRIKMTITSDTVTAIKDTLGAVWSTEVMEDARGTLQIDVEAEMLQQMALEIVREQDERVLNEILTGATAGNVDWDLNVPSGYTTKEWYETLGHAFIDAEALIYAKRYRDAGFIIAGPTLAKYIRKMADFTSVARGANGVDTQAVGTKLIGTFGQNWDVYTSMAITTTKGIMGYYPQSYVDTGYVWAPYIPIAAMPLVYAEYKYTADAAATHGQYVNTDKWSRVMRTRNGKKMVVSDAYATITVTDSPS